MDIIHTYRMKKYVLREKIRVIELILTKLGCLPQSNNIQLMDRDQRGHLEESRDTSKWGITKYCCYCSSCYPQYLCLIHQCSIITIDQTNEFSIKFRKYPLVCFGMVPWKFTKGWLMIKHFRWLGKWTTNEDVWTPEDGDVPATC